MYFALQAVVWTMAHTAGGQFNVTLPAGMVTVLSGVKLVFGLLSPSMVLAPSPAGPAVLEPKGASVTVGSVVAPPPPPVQS